MAVYDIRGWVTDTGLKVPYFQVPITYNVLTKVYNQAIYKNVNSAGADSLYPGSALEVMRSVARRLVNGENGATLFLNNPGVHCFVKSDGTVESDVYITSSPGAWSYEDYTVIPEAGSSTIANPLNFYGNYGDIDTSRFNKTAIFRTQDVFGNYIVTKMSPFPPQEGMYKYTPLAAAAFVGPSGLIRTSDGSFV